MKSHQWRLAPLIWILAVTGAARSDGMSLSYDPIHRLTRVVSDNGTTISYTYDAAGNRLTMVVQSGLAPDRTPPVVRITDPTAERFWVTTEGALSLTGTATDATGIASLSFMNAAGPTGSVAGTTAWTAGPIALSNGINRLTVSVFDPTGNVGRASLLVVRLAAAAGPDPYSFDGDGDGSPDWCEILAGTSPTDSNSVFALRGLTPPDPPRGFFAITWASETGIYYSVYRATNLLATAYPFYPLKTGIPGEPGTTSYADTNLPPSGPFFYKVEVEF